MDPVQVSLTAMASVSIDVDKTFFVQLGIVLLLMAVLKKLIFEPYLATLDAREAKTVRARAEADDLRSRAATLEGQYRSRIETARDEGLLARRQLRLEGAAHKDEVIGATRAETNAAMAAAQEKLDEEVSQTRNGLLAQVDDLTRQVVEKVLGRGV